MTVGLLVPFAPSLPALVALRAVQGAALAGLPASATAYLAEEVTPRAGRRDRPVRGGQQRGRDEQSRVITGWVAQEWGWRIAVGVVGALAVACAVAFRLLLPAPKHFTPGSLRRASWPARSATTSPTRCCRRLYAIGALFMTVFGGVYTVIGYRLAEPRSRFRRA